MFWSRNKKNNFCYDLFSGGLVSILIENASASLWLFVPFDALNNFS